MTERVLRQIVFENHLQTLRALGLDFVAAAAFDTASHLVWCDALSDWGSRTLHEIQDLLPGDRGVGSSNGLSRTTLAGGGEAISCWVEDDTQGRLLRLLLLTAPSGELDEAAVTRLSEVLAAVSRTIANEFQLNAELESMAGELSERYDELNLVFQADTSATEGMFGYESLRRLVRDTTEFLDVGMASLMLPARALQIHYQEDDIGVTDLELLLSTLRASFFDRLRETREAIVINNRHDMLREGLSRGVGCKLLISPVQGAGTDIAGMLVVVQRMDQADFSNSDRNLLDLMATKITKILQVNFDGLTGLENSHSFEWAVGQALQQSRSRGFVHAVLHIDIDRTGVVNDVSGREAGDELIRVVGRILSARVRSQDIVARISGDQFGVLLENCPLSASAQLAEDIARKIESTDFRWKGTMHPLTVCMGVAPITGETETVAAVMSAAEVACNAAKEQGRNRIQVYEQNDAELLRRRGEFRWVARIQSALRDGRFELHAQLINRLQQSDEPPHYEVLVRMLDENHELVPPGEFIPPAEHYHLMPAVDRWIVHQAAETLAASAASFETSPVRLSVNLSGQSLGDEQTKTYIYAELERLGGLAKYLCFEITESAAISNLEQALAFISALKAYGCRISLDDFGSGLSSFAYLQRFEVDFLKIDGSFVRRLGGDPVAEAMVSAINRVGKVMGLETIAEFVESQQIDATLRAIGVDFGQGYLYHRPVPLREVIQQLVQTQRAARA